MSFLLASRNFQSALLGHGAAPKKMLGKDLYRDPTGEHRVQNFIDGVENRTNRGNEKPKPTSESANRLQTAIEAAEHAELVAAARERAANLALAEDISHDLAQQEAEALRKQFGIDGPDSDFEELGDEDFREISSEEAARIIAGQDARRAQDLLRRDIDAKNKKASVPKGESTSSQTSPDVTSQLDAVLAKLEPKGKKEKAPVKSGEVVHGADRFVDRLLENDEVITDLTDEDLIEVDDEPILATKAKRTGPPAITEAMFSLAPTKKRPAFTERVQGPQVDVANVDDSLKARLARNFETSSKIAENVRTMRVSGDKAAKARVDAANQYEQDIFDTLNPPLEGVDGPITSRDVSKQAEDRFKGHLSPNERRRQFHEGIRNQRRADDFIADLKAQTASDEIAAAGIFSPPIEGAVRRDVSTEAGVRLSKKGEKLATSETKVAGEARDVASDIVEISQNYVDEALTAEDLLRELNGKEKLTWDDFEAIQDVLEREDIDFDDPRQLQMQMDLISKFGKSEQQWFTEQLLDRRTDAKVEQIRQRFENGQKPNAAEDLILIKWMERNKNREAARKAEAAAREKENAQVNAELVNFRSAEEDPDLLQRDLEGKFFRKDKNGNSINLDLTEDSDSIARQPEKPKGFLSGLKEKVMKSWAGKLILGLGLAGAVGMAAGNRESHDSRGQDGRAPATDVARVDNSLEPVSVPVGDWGPRAGTNRNAEGSSSDAATSKTEAATSHSDAVKSTSEVEKTPTPAKVTKTPNAGGSRGGSHDSHGANRVGHNSSGSPELAYQHNERIKMDHAPFEKSIQPKFEAGQSKYIAFEDGQNVLYKKLGNETMKFRFDGSGRPLSASISIGSPDRAGNLNVNAVVNFDTNGDAYLNGQRNVDFDSLSSQALRDFNKLAQL